MFGNSVARIALLRAMQVSVVGFQFFHHCTCFTQGYEEEAESSIPGYNPTFTNRDPFSFFIQTAHSFTQRGMVIQDFATVGSALHESSLQTFRPWKSARSYHFLEPAGRPLYHVFRHCVTCIALPQVDANLSFSSLSSLNARL